MLRAVGDELVRADVRRLALRDRGAYDVRLAVGLRARVDGRAAGPQAIIMVVGIDEDLVEVRLEEVPRLFALEVPPLEVQRLWLISPWIPRRAQAIPSMMLFLMIQFSMPALFVDAALPVAAGTHEHVVHNGHVLHGDVARPGGDGALQAVGVEDVAADHDVAAVAGGEAVVGVVDLVPLHKMSSERR